MSRGRITMPRRPDLPCSMCGKLMWRGTGTRLDGTATCQPCRAANAQHGKVSTYKNRGCRCDRCREAWNAECRKFGAHRRRARAYGVEYVAIDPLAIYERDGWLCGICGLAVDRSARFPEPGSPSLDHVVPMSRGGGHVPSNVQLAHFYCNSVKGARDAEVAAC